MQPHLVGWEALNFALFSANKNHISSNNRTNSSFKTIRTETWIENKISTKVMRREMAWFGAAECCEILHLNECFLGSIIGYISFDWPHFGYPIRVNRFMRRQYNASRHHLLNYAIFWYALIRSFWLIFLSNKIDSPGFLKCFGIMSL